MSNFAGAEQPASRCVSVVADDVHALYQRWAQSLLTLHPDKVVRNYASDATLIGLERAPLRSGFLEIRDHYVYFLQREPAAEVEARTVRLGCNSAVETGIQSMLLKNKGTTTAEKSRVRYSISYEHRDGHWLIVHHHMSFEPKSDDAPAPAVASFVKRIEPPAPPVIAVVKKPSRPAKPVAPTREPSFWDQYRPGTWVSGQPVFEDE